MSVPVQFQLGASAAEAIDLIALSDVTVAALEHGLIIVQPLPVELLEFGHMGATRVSPAAVALRT